MAGQYPCSRKARAISPEGGAQMAKTSEKYEVMYIPVSYTHLDVYKRQMFPSTSAFVSPVTRKGCMSQHQSPSRKAQLSSRRFNIWHTVVFPTPIAPPIMYSFFISTVPFECAGSYFTNIFNSNTPGRVKTWRQIQTERNVHLSLIHI